MSGRFGFLALFGTGLALLVAIHLALAGYTAATGSPPFLARPFLVYFIGYALLLAGASRLDAPPRWAWWALIASTLVMVAAAVAVPAITSDDIYLYVAYGRKLAVLGLSPYATPLIEQASDPIIANAKDWWWLKCVYGPVAVAAFAALNYVTPQEIAALLFSVKAFMGIGHVAFGAALWLSLRAFAARYRFLALCAVWVSPFAIFLFVVDAHIDVWFCAVTLFALSLWQRERFTAAAVLFAVATGLKLMLLLVLPFLAIQLARRSWRALVWPASMFVLLYGGMQAIAGGGELLATLRFSQTYDNPYNYSILPTMAAAMGPIVGQMFDWPVSVEAALVPVKASLWLGLAVFALYLWHTRGEMSAARLLVLPYLWVFAHLTYLQPWYVMWFLPVLYLLDLSKRQLLMVSFAGAVFIGFSVRIDPPAAFRILAVAAIAVLLYAMMKALFRTGQQNASPNQ